MKALLVLAGALSLALAASAHAREASPPRALHSGAELLEALQWQQLAEGSPATLDLEGTSILPNPGAPLPIRLPKNADLTLQAAGDGRSTLEIREAQQLLVVPAGGSLTLRNLDIRVRAYSNGAPATRPPHSVKGLPLWPAIQLESGAALHLSGVSISLPAGERCLPVVWQPRALELELPVLDAGSGSTEPAGTAVVTFERTTIACGGLQGRRGRTTLQAPSRQAGTPLEFMVSLVNALGLDAGSSTIQLTGDIALTQADVAGRRLPLRLGPGQTLVIEGGPGQMKRLDVGGVQAPQLLFLEPNSTLIFAHINVSGWAPPSVGHATLPTHTDALPTWPTIGGAPGAKMEFKNAYVLKTYELCTPEYAQAQATGLQQQAEPGEWVEWIPGRAALHFDQYSSFLPIFNATDQSQIGLFGFNVTNTTMACNLPSNSSSTEGATSSGGSSFPVAAVAVPVAVVAAAALVGGLVLWHRRRKRARELLPMTGKAVDGSTTHKASSDPGTPPPGKASPNVSGNLGSLTPHGSLDLARAGELPSGVLMSRVGHIAGLVLGRVLGGGGYGRVFLGRWRGAAVAVKVVPATVEAGKQVDLSREPLLSVLLQHPSIMSSYKTCVVRILVAEPPAADSGQLAADGEAAAGRAPSTSSGGSAGGSKGPASQGGGRVVRSLTDRNALVEVVASDAVLEPGMYEAWIVSEYADRGSLHEAIAQGLFKSANPPGLDLEPLLLCLLDIARGLEFLHSCSIIHGDLKPQNVLLKTERRDRRGYVAKLADFGLSRIMGAEQTSVETGNYGTATHAAPERMADGRLTFASDIYSFGCIMWEMLAGERIWADTPTLQIISLVTLKGYRPPAPNGCPVQLAELMQRCWQADPRDRPNAAGVIEALIGFAATLRDSMRASVAHSAREQPIAPQAPGEQPHVAPSGAWTPSKQRCDARSSSSRRQPGRLQAAGEAAAGVAAAPAPPAPPAVPSSPLLYSGVIFDMDGTLTVSNIDYVTMRKETEIPVGDLFTVMESWDDGDRIKKSMDLILELEAQASASLQAQPGLLELLAFLRAAGVKVGLVTRNTTESVDAFFATIGEEWRPCFDVLLTRDNTPFVKPDPRSLLHFSETWGLQPFELLMVGDSLEDIETANAAGTASCLIAGGGNETSAASAAPPPLGAVPTFTVDSLAHLQQRLAECNTALGWGAYGDRTLSLSSSTWDEDDEDAAALLDALPGLASLAGAPPAGLDFIDFLWATGAVQAASCSFPRIDSARFGVPPNAHPGDRVLHLGCGDGALTKLLFARGLQVIGVDEDVAAARRRGLPAVQLQPLELRPNSLQPELAAMGGQFDAVVFHAGGSSAGLAALALGQQQGSGEVGGSGLAATWWREDSLGEIRRVLKAGGVLALQAPVVDEAGLRQALLAAGFRLREFERALDGSCRLVAAAE